MWHTDSIVKATSQRISRHRLEQTHLDIDAPLHFMNCNYKTSQLTCPTLSMVISRKLGKNSK